MLAKDQWRDELAMQGFVPYGEVVRLRRLCWLALALVVILVVVFGATIHLPKSFHHEITSPWGDPQPAGRGHLKGSSGDPARRPQLHSSFAAFLVDSELQIGDWQIPRDCCNCIATRRNSRRCSSHIVCLPRATRLKV